ncbi:hypothetical protein [Nonomuraea sp. LPB2021202275-12-8]|uniref:hypothetical protein n=1 Tax=Nonomuraea sp. LPB2021202275-12-8 TaxID=3120159 RepID=UPI00300D0ADC
MSNSLANLVNILTTGLLCVLLFVGVVVSGMARRQHGRAATIGMAGFLLLLLEAILRLVQVLTFELVIESVGPALMDTVFMLESLLGFLFTAIGVGLLIWAVVARRTPPPPPQPPQPQGWQQPGWQQPPGPQPGWQQPGSGQG